VANRVEGGEQVKEHQDGAPIPIHCPEHIVVNSDKRRFRALTSGLVCRLESVGDVVSPAVILNSRYDGPLNSAQ
jgi:hypothetical protein